MASNINSTDIDAEYPVAGVDNDSQGFRDNFSTIKNSLATAKGEITDLQTNTAKLNANNDFNGNKIQEADFIATTETVYSTGNITASQNISFANGHYQTVQVGADVTLTLADWPTAGKMARMRLQITSDGSSRQITFAASGGGEFKSHADWPGTFIIASQTNPIIVDFWTINGGLTVFRQTEGSFS
jgi:hypothetical protein